MKTLVRLTVAIILISLSSATFKADGAIGDRRMLTQKMIRYSRHSLGLPDSLPDKPKRVNAKTAGIFIVPDDNIPANYLVAAQAAADYWSAQRKNKQPIRIKLEYDNFEPETAIYCDIVYNELEDRCMPSSLYHNLNNISPDPDNIDGIIRLNNTNDWSYHLAPDPSKSGGNVYSFTLRCIAICLGFGSSLTQDGNPNSAYFSQMNPSVFDRFIIAKDGKRLTDYHTSGQDPIYFAQKSEVYFEKTDSVYRLYSPNYYELGRSLVYLNNPNSLMHYDFGNADQFFHIDETTLDILRKIGWNIAPGPLYDNSYTIKCDQLDENGVGSGYEQKRFYLQGTGSAKPENCQWSYILITKDGKSKTVHSGTTWYADIPPLTDPSQYLRNSNGDVFGRIEWSYLKNGKYVDIEPLNFALTVGPEILSVSNIRKKYSKDKQSYQAVFDVAYRGTDYIKIEVEEEFDPGVRTTYSHEPLVAHVETGQISRYFNCWIDITAIQGDLVVTHTIEFEGESYTAMDNTEEKQSFNLYNPENGFIGNYSSMDEIYSADIVSGIYIVHELRGKEVIQSRKISIR